MAEEIAQHPTPARASIWTDESSKIADVRVGTPEAKNSAKNQKREELIEQKSSVDSKDNCLDLSDNK